MDPKEKYKINIEKELFSLQEEKYREFNQKLVPGKELIGIRIPKLRKLAKEINKKDPQAAKQFLKKLPHRYLEENHLHAFLLQSEKDLDTLIQKTEKFLPYIDNWQTCDSFLPKLYKKAEISQTLEKWLKDDHDFTRRYAMRIMMLRQDYDNQDIVNVIKSGKKQSYYVYIGAAWYLSMAAIENPEGLINGFKKCSPTDVLREATIRKIRESRQFTKEEKDNFRLLLAK